VEVTHTYRSRLVTQEPMDDRPTKFRVHPRASFVVCAAAGRRPDNNSDESFGQRTSELGCEA